MAVKLHWHYVTQKVEVKIFCLYKDFVATEGVYVKENFVETD